jgi:hypothetical protein
VPIEPARVAAAFDLGRPMGPVTKAARGELGIIWHLVTDRGEWAVKELLLPEGQTGSDVVLQLAALEAGLPLPRPVLADSGVSIVIESGVATRVYEWVDLDPDRPCPPGAAGELLAGVHGLGVPAGPSHWYYYRPLGPEGWKRLGDRARSATGQGWGPALTELLGELHQAERDWVTGQAPGPSAVQGHMDFNRDNVKMRCDGGPVILDWENAAATDPAHEVAMAAVEFLVSTGPAGNDSSDRRAPREPLEASDRGPARAFVEGYRDSGGRFEPPGPEVFAMAFVCQAHLLDLYSERASAPTSSDEQRFRATENLHSMTARLLTPALAFELLDLWSQ